MTASCNELAVYITKMWIAISLLALGFAGVVISAAFGISVGVIVSVAVMLSALVLAMMTYGVCECDTNQLSSMPIEWGEKIYQYQV